MSSAGHSINWPGAASFSARPRNASTRFMSMKNGWEWPICCRASIGRRACLKRKFSLQCGYSARRSFKNSRRLTKRRNAMKRNLAAVAMLVLSCVMFPPPSGAKIIVGLSSVNVAFLPVYVTEAKGFFKDEGLDVLLVLFNAGATNLQALIGGDVQIMGS